MADDDQVKLPISGIATKVHDLVDQYVDVEKQLANKENEIRNIERHNQGRSGERLTKNLKADAEKLRNKLNAMRSSLASAQICCRRDLDFMRAVKPKKKERGQTKLFVEKNEEFEYLYKQAKGDGFVVRPLTL